MSGCLNSLKNFAYGKMLLARQENITKNRYLKILLLIVLKNSLLADCFQGNKFSTDWLLQWLTAVTEHTRVVLF